MTETPGNPQRRREDDSSLPIAFTMPGDICKHCNKSALLKVKAAKLFSVIFVLCGCMPLVKVLLRTNTGHFQIFLNLFQTLHIVVNSMAV